MQAQSATALALARGKMEAFIWAPPRQFFVDTPSAVAVDLGAPDAMTTVAAIVVDRVVIETGEPVVADNADIKSMFWKGRKE